MTRFTKILRRLYPRPESISSKSGQRSETERPALKWLPLPKVRAEHQQALEDQGWTTITFEKPEDPLKASLDLLFEASKAFFALPDEYKSTYLTKQGSEDGWNKIEGEKEFITLRTIETTPKELQDVARSVWVETGKLLNAILGKMAETLDLDPQALTTYSQPCIELTSNKTATMLRLFRYEGHQAKVVAEPHCDLGLLSFVIGDTPGLEVWNRYTCKFWPIEQSYRETAGSLLVGRQLQRLSNGRYRAGGHQVQAYGRNSPAMLSPGSCESPYRYSIVFVLRAHSPVPIDTDNLTTEITGSFDIPLKCTAGELFRETKKKHYNVNTAVEERERQKEALKADKNHREHESKVIADGNAATIT